MKKIVKDSSPIWFENWKRNFKVANGRDAHYKADFSTDDTDGSNRRMRLKQQLIREQGEICCYCMKRISLTNSHIEHFWPKSYLKVRIWIMIIYLRHVMELEVLLGKRIVVTKRKIGI